MVERTDCDLDFESPAKEWAKSVVQHARESLGATESARAPHLSAVPSEPAYSKQQPFAAEVLTCQAITGRHSSKDVRHIEVDLEGSGLAYQPGDSLGVVPVNPLELVDALLALTNNAGDAEVEVDGISKSLRDALLRDKEVTALSRPILDTVARSHPNLQTILADRDQFTGYLESHQVIDLLHDYEMDWEPQELVDSLRRLTPRLYSIASCPDANPGEAHLTVAVVGYEKYGRWHRGVGIQLPTERNDAGTGLHRGKQSVPSALEWRYADHHGRRRDGHRTLSGVRRASTRTRAQGKKLACLWRSQPLERFLVPARMVALPKGGNSSRARCRVFARSTGKDLRAEPPLGKGPADLLLA